MTVSSTVVSARSSLSLDATLSRAADLAGRAFASTPEATDAILDLVLEMLNMQSAFLTRSDVDADTLRVDAARNRPGDFAVPVGLELPLHDSP